MRYRVTLDSDSGKVYCHTFAENPEKAAQLAANSQKAPLRAVVSVTEWPMLKDKNGALTAYGLNCGYVMSFENCAGRAELYKEDGVYHVRLVRQGYTACHWGDKWEHGKAWATFETLAPAKKSYRTFYSLLHKADQ